MREIEEIRKKLEDHNYISNDQIDTTLFLAFALKKPILIEGPPGTGKTELAKTIADSFDRDFYRIQCYGRNYLRTSCRRMELSETTTLS